MVKEAEKQDLAALEGLLAKAQKAREIQTKVCDKYTYIQSLIKKICNNMLFEGLHYLFSKTLYYFFFFCILPDFTTNCTFNLSNSI